MFFLVGSFLGAVLIVVLQIALKASKIGFSLESLLFWYIILVWMIINFVYRLKSSVSYYLSTLFFVCGLILSMISHFSEFFLRFSFVFFLFAIVRRAFEKK